MADTLISGTTLVEKESRSIGDVPIGGIVNWFEGMTAVPNLPEGYLKCDGSTIVDALSPLNGQTLPDLDTLFWAETGTSWHGALPDVDDISINAVTGRIKADGSNITLLSTVNLPHGAVVSGVIVYGNATAAAGITWKLQRVDHVENGTSMASAAVGTEDTTISNDTIDNENFLYLLSMGTQEFDTNDEIFGARITYTIPTEIKVMRVR